MKRLPLVVAALLAAACQVTPPVAVKPSATPASVAPVQPIATLGTGTNGLIPGVPAAPTGVTVTGSVRVPAGIIAAGGMNLVATGGGNMIAAGGMNYGLLAIDEQAVAGARVFLANAAGDPIPDIARVTTDATGTYTIANVPPDFTFVVAAEIDLEGGKKATFQTLAKPGKLGATASLDASTTLVAANLLEGVSGADLGEFNPAAFKTAAETTAKNLKKDQLPDFSDRAAVRTKIRELAETVGELKSSLREMGTELADVKKTLADLKAELERAKAGPQPGQPPIGPRPSGEPKEGPAPIGPRPSGEPGGQPPMPKPSGAPSGEPPMPKPSGAPSGQPPQPGASAACAIPGPTYHWFEVPLPEKIATVEFRVPQAGKAPETWPNGATGKKDVSFATGVSEGCPYHVVYKDAAGQILGVVEGFAIPAGSPEKVVLPQPTRLPNPAPSGQPPATACTTPVAHRVKTTTVGAAKIKFGVLNAAGASQLVAEASAGADGSFEVTVPQGCSHTIMIFDAAGTLKAKLPNYTIPAGSPRDIQIPI